MKKKKGEAVLTSISPGELELKVHSISNRGHIAVSGKTGYEVMGEEASFFHSLTFGFEIGPSNLKEEIKQYRTNRST